jgi:hypothetical protein
MTRVSSLRRRTTQRVIECGEIGLEALRLVECTVSELTICLMVGEGAINSEPNHIGHHVSVFLEKLMNALVITRCVGGGVAYEVGRDIVLEDVEGMVGAELAFPADAAFEDDPRIGVSRKRVIGIDVEEGLYAVESEIMAAEAVR